MRLNPEVAPVDAVRRPPRVQLGELPPVGWANGADQYSLAIAQLGFIGDPARHGSNDRRTSLEVSMPVPVCGKAQTSWREPAGPVRPSRRPSAAQTSSSRCSRTHRMRKRSRSATTECSKRFRRTALHRYEHDSPGRGEESGNGRARGGASGCLTRRSVAASRSQYPDVGCARRRWRDPVRVYGHPLMAEYAGRTGARRPGQRSTAAAGRAALRTAVAPARRRPRTARLTPGRMSWPAALSPGTRARGARQRPW